MITSTKYGMDIRERAFAFSAMLLKFCRQLDHDDFAVRTLSRQLVRAGTSIGANLEEAQAAETRADFIHKNAIVLKEARETRYWLRLLLAGGFAANATTTELQKESEELMKVLGAIVVSAKGCAR
jgi:four helix bundle protein